MVYLSGGEIKQRRSPWRLSIFGEIFWAIINLFGASPFTN